MGPNDAPRNLLQSILKKIESHITKFLTKYEYLKFIDGRFVRY